MLPLLLGLALASPLPKCELGHKPDALWIFTVDPGEDVWNAFGHSAIYVRDKPTRTFRVFNYGQIQAADADLVYNFATNQSRYMLGTRSRPRTIQKYEYQQRGAIAQQLLLPDAWRAEVVARLRHDNLPENREYLYNPYTNNCTTKLRDLLDDVSGGQLQAQMVRAPSGASAGGQTLRIVTTTYPLIWFGLNWGVGRAGYEPIDVWHATYLPDTFAEALDTIELSWPDGVRRPLVANSCRLTERHLPGLPQAPPPWDGYLAMAGLGLGGALAGAGRLNRKLGLVGTALFGLLAGGFGCLTLLCWSLGTFAPFWGNHNLWFIHPGTGALTVAAIAAWRGKPWAHRVGQGLLGIVAIGVLAALLAALADQNLGELMLVLPTLLAASWILRPVTGAPKPEGEGLVGTQADP